MRIIFAYVKRKVLLVSLSVFLIFCLIFIPISQLFSHFFHISVGKPVENSGILYLLHPYWLTCRILTEMLTKHTIDLSVFFIIFYFNHSLVFKWSLLLSIVEQFTWKPVAVKYPHFVDRAVFTRRLNSWLSAVLQQSFPIQVFLWMKLETGSGLWLINT